MTWGTSKSLIRPSKIRVKQILRRYGINNTEALVNALGGQCHPLHERYLALTGKALI
jgi:hypothetical protein